MSDVENDPWAGERQQWMEALENSNRMIARVEKQLATIATTTSATTKNANVGQTPMMKSIATPPSPPNAMYKHYEFSIIQNIKEGDEIQKSKASEASRTAIGRE